MSADKLWIQYSHLAEGGFGRVMWESDFKEFTKCSEMATAVLREILAAQGQIMPVFNDEFLVASWVRERIERALSLLP